MPRQFRLSVCLPVCLSVTRVYYVKTAERIIEILSPSDRTIILVFRHQGSLCKSEGDLLVENRQFVLTPSSFNALARGDPLRILG